ncbi:MAG: ABC transporter substrate-binding protein [Candidatus Omnitrophota bacterium]
MRLKKFALSFVSLIVAFVSITATIGLAEGATTVTDGLGRKVTVERIPQRIVSTIPSNTEILYDLGLKDKVIAVTSHCEKTCDITGKSVIGGWSDKAIIDKIVELKPDLVLAFGGLQSPLAAEMEKRNITTFVFFPETVEQTLEQILLVAKITGTTKAASDIVNRCRNNLKKIEEKFHDIPMEKRLKVLRLMSTKAMVIGRKSFQSDILKRAGGINIFEDIEDDYPVVSLEEVQAKDPDTIIFNRNNEQEAIQWFLEQPGWNELRAAKERRLISISCDYICHPNTRIDKTVEILAARFYPGRFKEK